MIDVTGEFQVGSWRANPLLGQISQADQALRLQPKTMNVLVYLANHANEVATRDDLLEAVWGASAVSDEPLTRCIAELRKSLGDKRGEPSYIETIPKRGYRLIASVSTDEPSVRSESLLEAAALDDNSVAVLPLRDLSRKHDQQYFAEGITEEIASALASRSSLKVVAHNSTRQLSDVDPATVRDKLRVRYVVSGSVRKDADKVRITLDMADTLDGYEIWSQIFDRKLEDIFAIQTEIANSVVEALPAPGEAAPWEASGSASSDELAANDHYLRGLQEMRQRSRSSMYMAAEHFVRAVERDPGCVKALAGEAMIYALMPWYGLTTGNRVSYTRAIRKAQQALSVNPELPDAHVALGLGMEFQYQWEAGEQSLLKALELSPSHAEAHHHYGTLLGLTGRLEDSLEQCRSAEKVDPLSAPVSMKIGILQYAIGETEAGRNLLEKVAHENVNLGTIWTYLTRIYLSEGLYDEAGGAMKHDVFLAGLTREDRDALLAQIQHFRETGSSGKISPDVGRNVSQPAIVAGFHALAGDYVAALESFRRGAESYDPFTLWINIDPALTGMRDMPEYSEMKAMVGIK